MDEEYFSEINNIDNMENKKGPNWEKILSKYKGINGLQGMITLGDDTQPKTYLDRIHLNEIVEENNLSKSYHLEKFFMAEEDKA